MSISLLIILHLLGALLFTYLGIQISIKVATFMIQEGKIVFKDTKGVWTGKKELVDILNRKKS